MLKRSMALLGLTLSLSPGSARADALSDADARAAAYRATQPKQFVDGHTPESVDGAVVASVPYEQEVIGDGIDLVTGAPRALCFLPADMSALSQALNYSESMLTIAQSNYEVQTYFASITDVSASINAGSYAATAHIAADIERSLNLSVHDLAVIAHYRYFVGDRWYNGGYVLDPAYDALRKSDPATFLGRCGHGFLQAVSNGVSMTVVFKVHQRQEVDVSIDDVKGALSARYGLAQGSASENLTDNEKRVLASYDVTSQCYVQGGHIDTCSLIRNVPDIFGVWSNLTSGFTSDNAVTLKTGYMTYADAFNDKRLNIAPERIRLEKLWEQQRSWVENICSAAPYIPDCAAARTAIDNVELEVDDPHATNVPEPGFGDDLAVFLQADLGTVTCYANVNGGGDRIVMPFSLNPKAVNTFKPDVVYMLRDYNFANLISSASSTLNWPTHWVFELYSNEDGTGTSWQLGNTNGSVVNVPQGHPCGVFNWGWCDSFNDTARSFRLRYVP